MSRIQLIPKEGRFYKANLHSHTTVSDGNLTPEEMKEKYKAAGYSVIAMTDHNILVDHRALNDPDFLTIPGTELHVEGWDGNIRKTIHLNALAMDPDRVRFIAPPAEYSIPCIQAKIDELRAGGFIINYNHPDWSSQEPSDYLPLEGFTAMEAYNHISEIHNGDGKSIAQFDNMLRHGKRLFCIATDDNHNELTYKGQRGGTDSFGGWTMIRAAELSHRAIMDAFTAGSFYCSTGPEIYDYYIEDGMICIDCEPVANIYVKSVRPGSSDAVFAFDDELTHAAFPLAALPRNLDGSSYARIDIVRKDGKTAYTNPYYMAPGSL